MSRAHSHSLVRLASGTAIVGPAVGLVIAAGLAVPSLELALRSVPAALTSLVDLNLPRWIHNLSDLLQIATPLVAIAVWGTSRRKRR